MQSRWALQRWHRNVSRDHQQEGTIDGVNNNLLLASITWIRFHLSGSCGKRPEEFFSLSISIMVLTLWRQKNTWLLKMVNLSKNIKNYGRLRNIWVNFCELHEIPYSRNSKMTQMHALQAQRLPNWRNYTVIFSFRRCQYPYWHVSQKNFDDRRGSQLLISVLATHTRCEQPTMGEKSYALTRKFLCFDRYHAQWIND